jgi:hypothetical protein
VDPLGTAFFNRELVNRNNGWVATPGFTNPERSQNWLQIWVVDAATDAPNLASTLKQGALAAPVAICTLWNSRWSRHWAMARGQRPCAKACNAPRRGNDRAFPACVTYLHDRARSTNQPGSFEVADIRPHRATAFVDAAPIGGRGHRTRPTELLISERDRLIIEAARRGSIPLP